MFDKLRSTAVIGLVTLLFGCTPTAPGTDIALAPTAEPRAFAQNCKSWDEWDKPTAPFRIHGNSYYVGSCGISAILIVGENGHILIDSGTEIGADIVTANICALDIDPSDIKFLLHSHEHFDHVGGFAKLRAITGARILSSIEAANVLRSGHSHRDDPQYGLHAPMSPVQVDANVENGDIVQLGNLVLTAMDTPGHSPGALSWAWRSCELDDCLNIVYADSLSPVSAPDYRFGDHPSYVGRYRQGLKHIADAPCDVLITPHPSASKMIERFANRLPLIDSAGCRNYARSIEARLDKRLEEEKQ